ncbi:MAG: hypothetical protein ACRC7N_13355 [Clostridium sp.]
MFSFFTRTAQPFSMLYIVNNTGKKLTDISIKLEDYKKEVHLETIKKGDVISRFLMNENLSGERNISISHSDEAGNAHEYVVFEKFKCENIQKLKLRLNSINADGTFKFECFLDKE